MPSRTDGSTRTGWVGKRNGRHWTGWEDWQHRGDGSYGADGGSIDGRWTDRLYRVKWVHGSQWPYWTHRARRPHRSYRSHGKHGRHRT